MKMYDMDQNSEEWYKIRMGIPTASCFSKIVKANGEPSAQAKAYAFELATENFIEQPQESYASYSMQLGHELEEEARDLYEKEMLCKVEQVGFITNYGAGYSPDGLVGSDGLIEIKSHTTATIHLQTIIDHKLPTKNKQQCQGGLMITNRKWIDFISYHPGFVKDKRLFIFREYRDEEFITELKIGIKKLNALVKKQVKKIGESNER